jgi:predicted acetyltransferase
MNIEIKKVPLNQKPVLKRIFQLYLYDFNTYYDDDVDRFGLFKYPMLDKYWTNRGRFPFLIYADKKIAGFVLVNNHSYLSKSRSGKSIAEFFVMPKYRGKDIGKTVAFSIFDMFPGKWEVSETHKNIPAQKFWRKVINEYTRGDFKETSLDDNRWRGPIQSFDSGQAG